MTKHLLSVLLGLSAAFGSIHAADFEAGGLNYNILSATDKTVEVARPTKGTYGIQSVTIPKEVSDGTETYTVVGVGAEAFRMDNSLIHISFPETVTSIGKNAFYKCISLTDLKLPPALESIGGAAFEECKNLTEIIIPGTIKEWGVSYGTYARTFANCPKITRLVIGEGITTLPNSSFAMLSVTWSDIMELELPSTLTDATNALQGNIPVKTGGKIICHSSLPVKMGNAGKESYLELAYENVEVTVPEGALEAYKADEFWGKFIRLKEENARRAEVPAPFRNAIGVESDKTAALTMAWHDGKALDNLTELVYIDKPVTIKDFMAIVLKEDRRFYAMNRLDDGVRIGYGFDTNGDGSRGIYVDGTRQFMNESLGYSVVWEKDIEKAQPASQYDHWQLDGAAGEWKYYVNGVLLDGFADSATLIGDGDSVRVEYEAADGDTEEIPYIFYLRPETQRGLWMQPEIEMDMAKGKQQYFPMLSTMLTTTDLQQYSPIRFKVETEDGEASNAVSVYLADALAGNCSVRLTANADEKCVVRPYFYVNDNGWKEEYADEPSTVSIKTQKPVESITFRGWPEGDIRLYDMFGFRAYAEPEDADFGTVVYELSDPAAGEVFAKSAYAFDHFFAHNTGKYTITAKTPDGRVSASVDFEIIDRERTEENDFTEGTLWLSEEWFGHSNGSINYVRPDNSVLFRAYEMVNPLEGFGCTSQYAVVYADKLLVMSKQYQDGGDPRTGGGRLTVADARTLEKLATFNDLGNGDGRACVGVNPHKAYIGATGGIGVLDLDKLTYDASGVKGLPTGGSTYSSQYGDMVASGGKVFVVRQGTGLIVIDAETDEYVKTISNTAIQGVTVGADGAVWYVDYSSAQGSHIYRVDEETLEPVVSYRLPSNVSCSWGTWNSTNFFAAKRSNKLFWNNNYCWDMDTESTPENVKPIITSSDDRWPVYLGEKKQAIYGSAAFDDRTGEILWAGCSGSGTDARFTYYNFTDIETGDIRSIYLQPDYYYFPALPIIPDKYAPALVDKDFKVHIKTLADDAVELDLSVIIDDPDNSPMRITYALPEGTEALDLDEEPTAAVTLEGKKLTVAPQRYGTMKVEVDAESNGKVSRIEIPVLIGDEDTLGINRVSAATGVFKMNGRYLELYGFAGQEILIYDINGTCADRLSVDSDVAYFRMTFGAGVYIVRASNGQNFKILVK